MSFGEALRDARQQRGHSQSRLAELAKVSRRTIIRWERGEASPWIPELMAVLGAMGLSKEDESRLVGILDTSRAKSASPSEVQRRHSHWMKRARIRADLTLAEVAAGLGCNTSTVARWEAGRLWPSAEDAERLRSVLGVSERELVEVAREYTIDGEADFQETLFGILWPWDVAGFSLIDARFYGLDEALQEDQPLWKLRAKIAYGWFLSATGRRQEAVGTFGQAASALDDRSARLGSSRTVALLGIAKSGIYAGSKSAFRQSLKVLDALEGRALDWELLALRFDAYAEVFFEAGDYAKAVAFSSRAIDAADRCGARLGRLLRFNRCRIYLEAGDFENALDNLAEFSEATPWNDVQEALTVAEIQGRRKASVQAEHWTQVARSTAKKYELKGSSVAIWNTPLLLTRV